MPDSEGEGRARVGGVGGREQAGCVCEGDGRGGLGAGPFDSMIFFGLSCDGGGCNETGLGRLKSHRFRLSKNQTGLVKLKPAGLGKLPKTKQVEQIGRPNAINCIWCTYL